MEDSFRSKGSYSTSKYSDTTSGDLMKQFSDQTISSNSSKKSKKHHTPKLDSKSFYPIEPEEPQNTNNQQANYGYNQKDGYVDKNWKQPAPRFSQNQNNNYQRNQQNWGDDNNYNNYQNNAGGNYVQYQHQGYNNNYQNNRNKNYNNNNHQYQNNKNFSKQPYQKYNNNYRKSHNSNNPSEDDSSSLKLHQIHPDFSSLDIEPQNETAFIADQFKVRAGLIGFQDADVDDDPGDLGDLLDGLTTESEADSASKGSLKKKPRERATYSIQGQGVELHNISRNQLIITNLKIELPCSGCTLFSYQILKRKIDEPWMSRRKFCKVCYESSKNYIETRYTDQGSDFQNGQLTIGKLQTASVSAEKTTVNNIREFDFEVRCAGCQNAYPFHCILYKDPKGHDQELIIDENVSCKQWNCYKLMVIRIKKIQLQRINNTILNAIPEANDHSESKEDSESL